jgi:hypothetical protein
MTSETAIVQCIACDRFTFKKASKEWTAQGFGNCDLREPFIVHGAMKDRECETFWPAPDAVVEKRKAWLKDRKA